MPFLTPEGGLDDLSDEDIQQLIALGIIPDQQGMLARQMDIAEKLRYNNMPEMRGNGRIQTAAHPLEFLASTLQGIKANKQIEELRKRNDELLQQQVAGRTKFYKSLRGPRAPSQPLDPLDLEGGYE